MTPDTAKTVATYTIALVVIIGGGILLLVPSQVPSDQLLPFLTGIVGTVIGYVFSERSSSSAARRVESITSEPASRPAGPTTEGPG